MLTLIALCALTFTPFDRACVLNEGIVVSMTSEDPCCEHDPGNPASFNDDYWYPLEIQYNCWAAYEETGMGQAYWDCFNQHAKVYQELVEISAHAYRMAVCSCWTEWPNNPSQREICIENALWDYQQATNSDKAFLDGQAANCCPAHP